MLITAMRMALGRKATGSEIDEAMTKIDQVKTNAYAMIAVYGPYQKAGIWQLQTYIDLMNNSQTYLYQEDARYVAVEKVLKNANNMLSALEMANKRLGGHADIVPMSEL